MGYRVAVIGLGNVGLPTALEVQKHFIVVGFDINPSKRRHAREQGLEVSEEFPVANLYLVAVNTYWTNGEYDVGPVSKVLGEIKRANPDATVVLESTMPVCSSRELSLLTGLKLAVCPHRLWDEDLEHHGVVQPRVLGAINQETLHEIAGFYQTLEVPVFVVPSLEYAELSKLAENTDRYLKIAYAQELKLICDKHNLNYDVLKKAVDTHWRVKLLEPRQGIGKECLPKDIMFLLSCKPDSFLLNGAVSSNIEYISSLLKEVVIV